jgi:hypothetical protein
MDCILGFLALNFALPLKEKVLSLINTDKLESMALRAADTGPLHGK